MTKTTQKKRHHYVPVAYLARFSDASARLFAYRKDGPWEPLHVRSSEIAFEKYYYSQPLPEGDKTTTGLRTCSRRSRLTGRAWSMTSPQAGMFATA